MDEKLGVDEFSHCESVPNQCVRKRGRKGRAFEAPFFLRASKDSRRHCENHLILHENEIEYETLFFPVAFPTIRENCELHEREV